MCVCAHAHVCISVYNTKRSEKPYKMGWELGLCMICILFCTLYFCKSMSCFYNDSKTVWGVGGIKGWPNHSSIMRTRKTSGDSRHGWQEWWQECGMNTGWALQLQAPQEVPQAWGAPAQVPGELGLQRDDPQHLHPENTWKPPIYRIREDNNNPDYKSPT